ncbi:MAG: hypothetical protein A2Y03_11405 [Omnitrophica WOR_2 bacterium GWF2_38_59]|nr:MAG: hypothetical protein A2Y06_07390 [Omnitrophica WOR_2 bacterium GWA2_37_7]OGX25282.1 MAG: hypothetical protein A2Y03_11405 [Omnitrophica WOR_2 bacterium GWF2_38_59]OGX47954.1 MAG: hypothetical protein A2243_01260 [Omnitrophica WOR_2 bacterium RIFOXYA2_FULL_38_17]OGX51800.1 MAG: hypothetical protein A2267_10440 [Omnitrophica WOR_2 bacterium RIFOXYA12_FULL_38_10]OGX56291.1 MAG: hypothetical protein A2447_08580 [Omnitrophica WOR_2 bacterium RIFOXYC2_FULL_38_12]OGX60204.1 MAG: hypothetical 
MGRIKSFFITTLIGGVIAVLPTVLILAGFAWLFRFVTNLIQPLTNILLIKSDIREITADIVVIGIIVLVCFVIGFLIRTRFGKFIFQGIESTILKSAPGYNLIKETILQILGRDKAPFSGVALAQILCNDTLATSFITDEHEDGSFTVFVPTGPNPTSGQIFHLNKKYVHKVDVSVEDAMRSIISCGAGSSDLIKAYKK